MNFRWFGQAAAVAGRLHFGLRALPRPRQQSGLIDMMTFCFISPDAEQMRCQRHRDDGTEHLYHESA